MLQTLKDFVGRIRVRLTALFLTLLPLVSFALDQLGLIDLRPALSPIFGSKTELALIGITILLGLMKPMVSLIPKPADAVQAAVVTLMTPEAQKSPQVTL